MRNRKEILEDIIYLNGTLRNLESEISLYPWDSEEPIVLFKKMSLIKVLERFLKDEKLFRDIEYWANLIECRDDIDFENDSLREYVYELANPLLSGENTKNKIQEILNKLQGKVSK